jgi:3-oxoacyl-[acyl-carrier protein] reductase
LGIGRAVAEAFYGLGATVAVNGRNESVVTRLIEELGGGPRLVPAVGDVATTYGREAVVHGALRALGGLDVLVNNAGRGDDATVDTVTEEHWDQVMDLNLKATFFVTQACLPALRLSRGCVVNISSAAGLRAGPPGSSVYSTTKAAVVQMTRMLALSLAHAGVRVNALCPGFIDTPMIQKDNEKIGDNALYAYINSMTPMGRIGTVEECAGAVLYLAAPFAGYTTGAALATDGCVSAGR